MFLCQFAAKALNDTGSQPLLNDAIIKMSDIASYIFCEENLEIAVHGGREQFD